MIGAISEFHQYLEFGRLDDAEYNVSRDRLENHINDFDDEKD
eukprot:CAMPEP_0197043528 /NCGR_PEP_ID=MMETSP1384-20130603/19763_1 /TAXON_ID=29189 /ORGANISM="Ammonia sp." /LENGTH=41 /DNA_ID= /DNA_START= /DNA_END= /DNA_ORIENTATION=